MSDESTIDLQYPSFHLHDGRVKIPLILNVTSNGESVRNERLRTMLLHPQFYNPPENKIIFDIPEGKEVQEVNTKPEEPQHGYKDLFHLTLRFSDDPSENIPLFAKRFSLA